MAEAQPVAPDTVVRIAVELVGTPIRDEDVRAIGALLSGLVSEMGFMRAMEIPDTEPATAYDPSLP